MEGLDLTLGFAQNDRGRERFTDGLALDLSGQAVVRTVAGLIGLMASTIRFSASTADGGDGSTAEIAEVENAGQNSGSL